ncbi:serine/threonine-protein kinase [Nitrosomonas sp.]|uniref:serine/threonine protein kinase n=1 Tax=Nitrosomonas sp. TaxID=42353 RepID=UPI0020823B1B|nr:serine/threonine-protein kinase [Nitrosomonas sp.]GJL76837.1 MAG: hypothetical protein NMNS02_29430 [Nitrosomonas sp.]
MIGKALGNLKIVSKIGEGGMGVVYLAENIQLNNRFAVKSLAVTLTQDSGFRERFKKEALNQALLSHPNIVQAIDFFDEDGQFFLVMEYVNGQGLNELIKKTGKLSEEEALRILKDILRGLNFAHSKGVIHRDIKPSNVIVDEDGRARITDFGIAILVGEKRLTTPGANVGSSWYMSPEQIVNPTKIDHRSDVYAAGIVLYEMLTGDVPFDGESEFTIQNKQVKDTVPDPSKRNPLITQELKEIMMKALEKDPDKRFSGCGEFLKQIEEYEKRFNINRPIPRWKILIAVIAVVSIIAVAYKFGSKDLSGEYDNAYDWIRDATEKTSIICREIKTLNVHQRRFHTASNAVGSDKKYADSIADRKQQIQDLENNINDYLDSYLENIGELSNVEKAIVDEELRKYSDELADNENFHRIRFTQIVMRHYLEASTKGKINVNIEDMKELCHKK